MALHISSEAEDDLQGISDYIGRDSPRRAKPFLDEIIKACMLRVSFPRMSRPKQTPDGMIYTFPFRSYVVVYEIFNEYEIMILRVIHSARDVDRFF